MVYEVQMNRLHNTTNRMQGDEKRVLCCCSAGMLRSPTASIVLGTEPFNYNTRAVGLVDSYALIPIDPALAFWADEFVVMEEDHRDVLIQYLDAIVENPLYQGVNKKPIIVLGIPDHFKRMDPELQKMIAKSYKRQMRDIGGEV